MDVVDRGFPTGMEKIFLHHRQAEGMLLVRGGHQIDPRLGNRPLQGLPAASSDFAQHLLQPRKAERDIGEGAAILLPQLAQTSRHRRQHVKIDALQADTAIDQRLHAVHDLGEPLREDHLRKGIAVG